MIDCKKLEVCEPYDATRCAGMRMTLPFYGRFLYWGKKIDKVHSLVDKSINFLNRLINVVLLLFGLSGLAALLAVAYVTDFNALFTGAYWVTPTWEKGYFWLTVFGDLYLYSRLAQESSPRKRVFPRIFSRVPPVPVAIDWEFIRKQPRHKRIDISEAFTTDALEVFNQAWLLAREFNHGEVSRIHILAVLPQFDQGALVWGRLGIKLSLFKEKVARVLKWNVSGQSAQTDLSLDVHALALAAYMEAHDNNKKNVEVVDIIKALTMTECVFSDTPDYVERILIDLDLDYQKVINVVAWIQHQRQLRQRLERFRARARYRSKSGLDRAMTAVATPVLDRMCVDLTMRAKYGQLFPCIGRDGEFEAIYRIIEGSRAGVLLVGNHGVGRTAIIEGLAQKMVEESVPPALHDKRLVSLSVSHLLSGVSPADAEERLLTIAGEAAQARNVVMVVEDLHLLTGITAGGGSSLDVAAVLAEIAKKGLFLIIATTTPSEYSRAIEGGELDQTFQTVKIDELNVNDAIQVLEVKSGAIEYKNNVFFSYDAIEKSVVLSMKYIHDRYLPEKAVEILEEVAVKVRKERGDRAIISGEDVAIVLSEKTGVVATKITESESEKLLNLEQEIHGRVIGQDEAVEVVASSLRRARAELRDTKRPIASLLFLGPTGVGKTELAKTVASVYFGREDNMHRFDMSEYQDPASVARLIGGSQQPGLLTEAVRQKPFALVLFDEVEKAHTDILNLFLQVMDDGRLTDGLGRTIDFTNTIIIMTSNAGAPFIQDKIKAGAPLTEIKETLINETLREHFRPELLNRFDGIVVFKPLTLTEVVSIARLLTDKVRDRLAEKNITLTITDAAIAELAELGYDPKFGARPLRRAIQDRVDNALADFLLRGTLGKRDVVVLDAGGQIEVHKAEET